jgi:EmrB/QacA subfamily drug resistance transporter
MLNLPGLAALSAYVAPVRAPGAGRPGGGPAVRRGLVPAIFAAALAAALAQTIVLGALPVFRRDLGVSQTEVAWVLTAFMLASGVTTPIFGRLGDMLGYRRVLVGCLLIFAAGTVVAALGAQAGDYRVLLAGRVVQGLSGGVFPLAFGIVRSAVPASRIPAVIGVLSAMIGIGGAIGMVAAGPIVDHLGTAWLFWATLGLVLVALAGTPLLPATRPTRHGGLDVVGAVLLSGALVALLLGISRGKAWGWGSPPVAGLFAASAVVSAVFVAVELRREHPLVDLRMMRRRSLAATNLATVVVGAAMFGAITLVPQYVQTPSSAGYGFDATTTGAGLVMIPVAVMMLIASPLSSRLAARAGPRVPFQTGAALAVGAYVLLCLAHGRLVDFYLAGVVVGTAYGLAFASIGNLVAEAVERHQTGVATGVNTILRTIGGAVGAQIGAAVLAGSGTAAHPLPTEAGYTTAFAIFALVALAALAATWLVPRRRADAVVVPLRAEIAAVATGRALG